jgi:hypothetical protein
MTFEARAPGSWKPSERVGRFVAWILLLLSCATLLTNSYYLRLLEPVLSRRSLALALFGVTGLWLAAGKLGLPRDRKGLFGLLWNARVGLALAAIVAVAFSVHYQGAGSGLPQSYVPDEYDYVHSYLQMIKRGDMNPRWWHHPSVQPYVNVVAYLLMYYAEASSGRWPNIQALQRRSPARVVSRGSRATLSSPSPSPW